MKAKQTEKLIALFTEMWTCWHLGQGFSPHTVIHIVVIESDEKSQDSEKDDYVGRDNQTRWSPHDLKERKKQTKEKIHFKKKLVTYFFFFLPLASTLGLLLEWWVDRRQTQQWLLLWTWQFHDRDLCFLSHLHTFVKWQLGRVPTGKMLPWKMATSCWKSFGKTSLTVSIQYGKVYQQRLTCTEARHKPEQEKSFR